MVFETIIARARPAGAHRERQAAKPRRPIRRVASLAAPVLTAGIYAVLPPLPIAAQSWPIKEFELVALEPSGNTGRLGVDALVRLAREAGLDPDQLTTDPAILFSTAKLAIETHLRESAELLESWGFPPPRLLPVVTTEDGREAFRIYLVKDLPDYAGQYEGACGIREYTQETVILLDAKDVIDRYDNVTTGGLATAGHELFHAVQFATPFFANACDPVGHWIMEGTARAVGWDLVRLLRSPDLSGYSPWTLWGSRNYSHRLPVPLRRTAHHSGQPDPAYETASLWRYLAEFDAGGNPPGPGPGPVDYRYLAQLLGDGAVARDCGVAAAECDAELRWLDDGLKSLMEAPLRDVLPGFLASYVVYGEHRVAPIHAQHQAEEWGEQWRSRGFGGHCVGAPVTLTPDLEGRRKVVSFSIEDVAGLCWEVEPRGFPGAVPIGVEITAPGSAALSQLSAAVGGTSHVDTAQVVSSGDGATVHTRWLCVTLGRASDDCAAFGTPLKLASRAPAVQRAQGRTTT